MEAGYYHTSESLSGSASFSDKEDSQVHPLPRDALREEWAARTQSFLRRRFLDRLRGSGIRYEVDLVKEYGPDSGVAVGHCICDAAEGLGADTVVVPRGAGGGDFLSQFVAHYCTRPVVLLSGRQLRRGPAAAAAPDCAVDALHPAPKVRTPPARSARSRPRHRPLPCPCAGRPRPHDLGRPLWPSAPTPLARRSSAAPPARPPAGAAGPPIEPLPSAGPRPPLCPRQQHVGLVGGRLGDGRDVPPGR